MSREVMQMALEAVELLARYESPQTKWTARKNKGGPLVTIYPHKLASDAAALLRAALAEPKRKRRTVKDSLTDDGWKRTREYCS